MQITRFKVQIKPEKMEEALAMFVAVVHPSRVMDGVIHFDGGRDITDPNTLIFTEVYEDQAAMERQEAQQEVKDVMARFGDFLAGQPEATIFHVSSSEPWGG